MGGGEKEGGSDKEKRGSDEILEARRLSNSSRGPFQSRVQSGRRSQKRRGAAVSRPLSLKFGRRLIWLMSSPFRIVDPPDNCVADR